MRIMTILAALLLASCGGRPATGDAPKKPKIGVVLMQQDQFFRLNEAGMRAAAGKAGVELRVQSAAGALDKEVAIVETFTAQGVDALVVSPLSHEGSVPALRRAHGVPLRAPAEPPGAATRRRDLQARSPPIHHLSPRKRGCSPRSLRDAASWRK